MFGAESDDDVPPGLVSCDTSEADALSDVTESNSDTGSSISSMSYEFAAPAAGGGQAAPAAEGDSQFC